MYPFYEHSTDFNVLMAINQGQVPTKPETGFFPKDLWSLCLLCWSADPDKRPTASDCLAVVRKLQSSTLPTRDPLRELEASEAMDQSDLEVRCLFPLTWSFEKLRDFRSIFATDRDAGASD